MNRRRKKKQQVDYVELVKQKFAAINWKPSFSKSQKAERVNPVAQFWQRLPNFHRRALMVIVPLFVLLLIVPLPNKTEETAELQQEQQDQPEVQSEPHRVAIGLNTQGLSQQRTSQDAGPKSESWKEYQVKNGDTLAQVFRTNQLSMADLSALVKIEGSDKPLSHIKQGQLIRFKFSADGQLDMLQLDKRDHSVMFFRLSDGSFGRNK